MKVIGIIGWKNSGKTYLAQKIIKKLTQKGLNISSIKRAHHNFNIDMPNSDSYLHRQSGSKQVIISSSKKWAKITELNNKKEKTLIELLNELESTDIVIVEGFKKENHPKIEIISQNSNIINNEINNVVAIVADNIFDYNIPVFKKNDVESITQFIIDNFL